MVINVNPNRISIQSTKTGIAAEPRKTVRSGQSQPFGNSSTEHHPSQKIVNDERVVIPAKASVNSIPAPESMNTMIRSAVDSLRKGVFWDRGTILNVVV